MHSSSVSFDDFLRREVESTKGNRMPNAISLRFVQLHEQDARTYAEEEEYQVLLGLMKSRWRWQAASADASQAGGKT